MKKNHGLFLLCLMALLVVGCAKKSIPINNMQTGMPVQEQVETTKADWQEVKPASPQKTVKKKEMFLEPHETLGLEPTDAIRRGDISVFMVVFAEVLFGEYSPGRLRWNGWVKSDLDGSEHFAQSLICGFYPYSNTPFSLIVVDGQVSSGHLITSSTKVTHIYGAFGKEVQVERQQMSDDPQYRWKKILEANTDEQGEVFNIKSLTRIYGFEDEILSWNQIQTPEGYLLSPYGVEEIALIRGINPQETYFQKLVGTGRFIVKMGPPTIGLAVSNAASLAIDLIKAGFAPSTGWDYDSELPSRRNMAFIMMYVSQLKKNTSLSGFLARLKVKTEGK